MAASLKQFSSIGKTTGMSEPVPFIFGETMTLVTLIPNATDRPGYAYFSTETIKQGKVFRDEHAPLALGRALEFAGERGIVATLPELLAAYPPTDGYKHPTPFTAHTEENIGIDKHGKFYAPGTPIVVVLHGGGLLTPTRMQAALDEGLVCGRARYTEREFDKLLEGRLENDEVIHLRRFDQMHKISEMTHHYGIVMPYALARASKIGQLAKNVFLDTPLAVARCGLLMATSLRSYNGTLANYHTYVEHDVTTPQGTLLHYNTHADYCVDGWSGLWAGGTFCAMHGRASH